MKNLLILVLVIALAILSYDYFRVREELTVAKWRIEKLEAFASRPHGTRPEEAQAASTRQPQVP